MPSSDYHTPRTVEEVTERNVETMRRLDQTTESQETSADRIAGGIARWCGRIQFVWLHVAWFATWMVFNSVPGVPHFDPYPFTFLILIVSLEAIFLSTFVLMSQNHEMRLTERRNQLDLQINLLSEQENTKMLHLLSQIANKLGLNDPASDVAAFEQATRPERLAEQIERAYDHK